jgi:hypothetical protein
MVQSSDRRLAHRRGLESDRQRALELLAAARDGCTEGVMLAHGFTIRLMAELVHAGLATATTERVVAGTYAGDVTRLKITDSGRQGVASKA